MQKEFAIKPNDFINVFVSKHPLKAKTTIFTLSSSVQSPNSECWFFFIDDMPFENWGHKCRYVFVDIHTRTIAVVKGSVPPTNSSELKELRAQKRELITTLTKHVITGTRYSYDTYMQESCSRPGIPESSLKEHEAYFVEPLCRVILQSYCFKAKGKITYDGITPKSTTLTEGQITFVLPAQSSGMPFNLYYHGGACKP